jgi:hypothetical protein
MGPVLGPEPAPGDWEIIDGGDFIAVNLVRPLPPTVNGYQLSFTKNGGGWSELLWSDVNNPFIFEPLRTAGEHIDVHIRWNWPAGPGAWSLSKHYDVPL